MLLAAALLGDPRSAHANPTEGEARSIVRDADRVYTVVAGEGDGASTVTNPANLGQLRGINGIFDLALMAPERRRRGSGAGVFVGLPLPLRLAAIGVGYQFLAPWQPESPGADSGLRDDDVDPQGTDDFFNKVTVAIAVPIGAWARLLRRTSGATRLDRLSIGMGYSRLISSGNFHAHGTQQVDVAISYWPSRYVALGLVGRAVNLPRTGRTGDFPGEQLDDDQGSVFQPAVIDPEIAIRPLGTRALELAVGARISPTVPPDRRYRTNFVDPRARLVTNTGGIKVFAEAEMLRYNPVFDADLDVGTRVGARLQAGVELNFSHFGISVAPLWSARTRSPFGVDGAALRLRLSQERYPSAGTRPRVVTKLALAKYRGDRGMWRVVEQLDAAAQRRGVVLLEARGMSLGWAQLEEVREAALRVRNRGGKVIAYLNGGSLRHYFLASAADRIIAHPNASISILGLKIQALYYRELLDRLGAKPEFVRVAEWKAWPETVHRNSASAPVARQRRLLYGDIWNHLLRMIARERGQDSRVIKEWIDNAPIQPPAAVRLGMIDDTAFPDELDAVLEDYLGRRIRIEPPSAWRAHAGDYGPPPRIAVLLVEGDIVQGDSFRVPLVGRRVAGDRTLTKEIERLRKDPSVRAVVVRVNSPGGDVWSADAITRELDLLRKEKPVVISMGNLCASGGYYIASAGQYIYADAMTMTGSIGIFYPKVDISGTLARLGIHVDEEDFGRRAGMRSWLRPYDDDERAAAQADIEASYAEFLGRVARARNMTVDQADRVARGRIWSGVRAIDEGLVDDYGGIREAILRARAIAGLRPDEGVIDLVPRPAGTLANLQSMFGFKVPSPLAAEGGGGYGAALPVEVALRSVVPAAMLRVLRHLPLSLWWSETPRPLALAEQAWIVED